jgi:hypothetical protein
MSRLLIALCAALLIAGCSIFTAERNSPTGGNSTAGIGLGTPVRDGEFEFFVTAVEHGSDVVKVTLNVKNIGDEAQMFSSGIQKLLVGGTTFEPSAATSKTLNPGEATSYTLAFKVPPGAVPSAMELHGSESSSGVKLTLS